MHFAASFASSHPVVLAGKVSFQSAVDPLIVQLDEIAPDGYLHHSRDHNILWFQKGGIAEHLTRDL
ncbi:MAG: hypothetical protein WBE76_21290 [Terracidiphilus sp.]